MKRFQWVRLAILAAVAVAWSIPGAHAQGSTPGDSGVAPPPFPNSWYLLPPTPCQHDSLTFVVIGYVATPCDSFAGASQVDGEHFQVRHHYYRDRQCFAAPFSFYRINFPLGVRSAGNYRINVEVRDEYVDESGFDSVAVRHEFLDFHVSEQCLTPPPPPGPLPFVTGIGTNPSPACSGRLTQLVLEGEFRSGCGAVLSSNVIDPEHVSITLKTDSPPNVACPAVFQHWRQAFNLGVLPPGPRVVKIRETVVNGGGVESDTSHIDPVTLVGVYESQHEFYVSDVCDSGGPPPKDRQPVLGHVSVGGHEPCDPAGNVACAGESLAVALSGRVFDSCTILKRIELLPSPIAGPGIQPPVVQLVFGNPCCLCEVACAAGEFQWFGTVRLPPLPHGNFGLLIQLAVESCGSESLTTVGNSTSYFSVSDTCGNVAAPCMTGLFPHSSPDFGCDASVAPERPAVLTLNVRTAVALSGLEGRFALYPPGLRVTNVEAVGSAAGMHVNWDDNGDGAHFVMFAEHGAPIPATSPGGAGVPALRVTVGLLAIALGQPVPSPVPRLTFIDAVDLLGSDAEGHGVPTCLPPPCVRYIVDPHQFLVGRICAEIPCDFNADGLTDVRDLVTMVHCVNGEGPCPDSAVKRFDCDRNGKFELDDVICCALNLLSEGDCPGCPVPGDSGVTRPEPSVKVEFGTPQGTAAGVDVPLNLAGASRLGAAALTLSFPSDRYEVLGVDVSDATHWLRLFQAQAGQLKVGLIRLSVGAPGGGIGANQVSLKLRLALKNGSQPGGEIAAQAGQFSGPDGVKLEVALGQPASPLLAAPRLNLSGPKPNPFSTTTRFSLSLDQAASVSLDVYDISGRKVASLWNGPLPAGEREFSWDGRTQQGVLAPGGVYFYRASSPGASVSRKMALLRRN